MKLFTIPEGTPSRVMKVLNKPTADHPEMMVSEPSEYVTQKDNNFGVEDMVIDPLGYHTNPGLAGMFRPNIWYGFRCGLNVLVVAECHVNMLG